MYYAFFVVKLLVERPELIVSTNVVYMTYYCRLCRSQEISPYYRLCRSQEIALNLWCLSFIIARNGGSFMSLMILRMLKNGGGIKKSGFAYVGGNAISLASQKNLTIQNLLHWQCHSDESSLINTNPQLRRAEILHFKKNKQFVAFNGGYDIFT